MCDLNSVNLIELNLDDDVSSTETQTKAPCNGKLSVCTLCTLTSCKCDSIENNPFDCAQNLANRLDDPFDTVEKEASLKGLHFSRKMAEVNVGNLLSLSDNNIENNQTIGKLNSNIDTSPIKMQELYLESPAAALSEKRPQDNVSEADNDSTPNSAESSASTKSKKNMAYRTRLLKLSLSNSTLNSPATRRQPKEFEDILGTPVSSIFCRAAEFGEHLLSAESPLKLVEEEESVSEDRQFLTDSEKKFEADLEMLKIPILNELPSTEIKHVSTKSAELIADQISNTPNSLKNPILNLEAIKSKLKSKKAEINDRHQAKILSIIHNLKTLLSSGEMQESGKKQQASELLESLTAALKTSEFEETYKASDSLAVSPQPIVRQGTFDIDIKEKQNTNIDKEQLVEEIPCYMTSSAVTYNDETPEEKQDMNLPDNVPISPQKVPSLSHCSYNMQTDINEMVEQLGQLFLNSSNDNQRNNNNPTFIVVMNSNQLDNSSVNHSLHSSVDAKLRSALVANYLENSVSDGSPDLTKSNIPSRRRSQSLSIHDKIKIIQLPLKPSSCLAQRQNINHMDETPTVITTPPSNGTAIPDFKTPARPRRNSYSSGTPYTTQVGMRRTGFGSETKNLAQMRRVQTLDTHHERQHHTIVRPLSNNLSTFKPDLKKRITRNSESIMKSSGPLKATIPMKKVAPMLKTSPPTPERNKKLNISCVQTTPMPTKESSILGEGVGLPRACSTPTAFTSPLKRLAGPVNKPRYSHMLATPNPKSSVTNSSLTAISKRRTIADTSNSKLSVANSFTGGAKRRTITDIKAKTPLLPHITNAGLQAVAAPSSRLLAESSRLSVSAADRTPKALTKPVINTATVKPTNRLRSRLSTGGSLLTTRNKENKRS